MNAETIEKPGTTMESNTAHTENTDLSSRLDQVEQYLVSIRAACWLAAIGIFALVVTQVV